MTRTWTPFPDLDAVLGELLATVHDVFGADLVGLYLVGSFAVGGADEHSDVDFLVVTRSPVSSEQEVRLRTAHAAFPGSSVGWAQHLEGSYVPVGQLRRLDPGRAPWLYVDNGSREMEWSAHDNNAVVRWSLRERGVVLFGPPPVELMDEVSADQLRDEAWSTLLALVEEVPRWAGLDNAWAQPYVVASLCRLLVTLRTGLVVSKLDALAWARTGLGARWHPLVVDAAVDRPDPWLRVHRPARPGSTSETMALAAAVPTIASALGLTR